MSNYRCYLLGEDGHYARVEFVESNADPEAIRRSRQILQRRADCSGLELWLGSQLVHAERLQSGRRICGAR